jgi:hypothetical protein
MFVILKSDTEKLYQLISYLGSVDELPLEIRRRGPWHVVGEGDEARVKPQYRSTLDRDGCSLVRIRACMFDRDGRRHMN